MNKRTLDPKKLNSIRKAGHKRFDSGQFMAPAEFTSLKADQETQAESIMDRTGDKFTKGSITAWNNSINARANAHSLGKRGKKSVVSDYRNNARHSLR